MDKIDLEALELMKFDTILYVIWSLAFGVWLVAFTYWCVLQFTSESILTKLDKMYYALLIMYPCAFTMCMVSLILNIK